MIKNKQREGTQSKDSHLPSSSQRSYLHVWRVVLCDRLAMSPLKGSLDSWYQPQPVPTQLCDAMVTKIFSGPFPLKNPNSHVSQSQPSCDIASSLQLQLPSLSSPYLFSAIESDGNVSFWQFKVKLVPNSLISSNAPHQKWLVTVVPYDVFAGDSAQERKVVGLLNCTSHPVLKELPLASNLPSTFASAYPGRFAMAHLLSKPIKSLQTATNPLGKHAMVSVWECESSGGQQWVCESVLSLQSLGMSLYDPKASTEQVLMDWLPMENGAYLLATCFSSVISIFGMAQPINEDPLSDKPTKGIPRRFSKSVSMPIIASEKAFSSWVCLLHFPCCKSYAGLSTKWLCYTGSNSIMIGVGCEMHIYSCWVNREQLEAFRGVSSQSRLTQTTVPNKHSRLDSRLYRSDCINLLDYAHSKNTPLPQYHPKILTDLLYAGKLDAVKLILLNLVKYLLLYQEGASGCFSDVGSDNNAEQEDGSAEKSRMRLLSFGEEALKRSSKAPVTIQVEDIPPVSLSQLNIFSTKPAEENKGLEEETFDGKQTEVDDDYDELFANDPATLNAELLLGEELDSDITFDSISLDKADFPPHFADRLSSILHYARLPDISDVEQFRLLAIAHTVARTKTSFGDLPTYSSLEAQGTWDLGTSTGAGYAASGFVRGGIGGGEAMDDCGLRYLLALQNYLTLSASLPKVVQMEGLAPCHCIWAFHSDAEVELLSNIPCIQEDRLQWSQLRDAGIGWWVRSNDTLRKLSEKLAKNQFMTNHDPLDASLFYLAMKKRSVLKGLFKTVGDQRMMQFFSNDFTKDRWHRAALKNAFSLLSKQRFEQAAAFFLLGDQLWDAVEVCINRLRDLQLAFVIIRLYEGDSGPSYFQLLKEHILGITTTGLGYVEPSPDPFLRSMSLWLLQDYLCALETLLVDLKASSNRPLPPNPAIFDFYFYLRSHPLLLRTKYPLKQGRSVQPSPSVANFSTQYHPHHISGVGDDSLTVLERNLVFSTAYHHLNSGSPLLALTVLAKLPKTEDMGTVDELVSSSGSQHTAYKSQRSNSATAIMSGMLSEESVSFTVGDAEVSLTSSRNLGSIREEEEVDWSKPVTSGFANATEDVDSNWPRPASAGVIGAGGKNEPATNDDFDWSKPVSAQGEDDFDWSTPVLMQKPDDGVLQSYSEKLEEDKTADDGKDLQSKSSKLFSCRGIFVLSLADQLQYNALLSLLTEELTTIHLPACCKLLWDSCGPESLPILPLKKYDATGSGGSQSTLVEWFEDEAFEGILKSLQGRIIAWLQNETLIVEEVCGLEISAGHHVGMAAAHAGYDLLTTLMNYTTIHAGTLPSMLALKMELMHLMNTLVPWRTWLSPVLEDADAGTTTSGNVSCAIFPAQLPLLTSSSLPSKHPLNLALHLRLMSNSVFELLSAHHRPPTASSPLAQTDRVFELCSALSHCVFLCLSPMRLHASTHSAPTSGADAQGTTPTTQRKRTTSSDLLEFISSLEMPNTKPSKWPGLENWPSSLLSDDGKDALPLCLVLMECLVVAYLGLISVAWTKHSIYDLLILTANVPTARNWTALFGGGKSTKNTKKSPSFLRNMRNVFSAVGKKREELGTSTPTGLFIAPKISLLSCSLNKPSQEGQSSSCSVNFEKEPDDQNYDGDDESVREEWMREDVGSTPEEEDHDDPDCYSWCLMNLGITKLVHRVLRQTIALTGMEVLEFITASPILYKLLRLIEDWETFFSKQVENHASAPTMLLPSQRDEKDNVLQFGPAIMRHKSILEAENSPFSDRTKSSRLAQRLWEYLVHQESLTETFIKYIFYNKRIGAVVDDEIQVHRILYREPDSPVASLCINSANTSVFALATSREVREIEVPDILSLECAPYGEEGTDTPSKRKSWAATRSSPEPGDDFVMIAPGPHSTGSISMGSHTHSMKRNSLAIPHMPAIGQHSQTGSAAALLFKRNLPGVKRMASHPNLAYYLTGSADGSLRMLEFGTNKPVSVLRQGGSAPSVTRIRFTPQGNKYGVTDLSGKLCLWQGIHTNTRSPYQTLNPLNTRRTISDFAFLGSSSLIATCGESPNSKNVCIWDTLMPPRSSIVKEFMCHEGGALAIAYSRNKQRLISGGKKGELSIIDVRQKAVVSKLTAHSSAVTCIVLNDTNGYFLTGSAEGDIKVWDLFTVKELTSIAGKHTRSRLFRSEGGVTDMVVDMDNMLYSCGYDGTVRVHTLNLPNS